VQAFYPAGRGGDVAARARRTYSEHSILEEKKMTLHLELVPVLSLVAGIAILIVPRLLNYIVAAYLILVGLAGLIG
jgi:hypothetical protein